MEERDIERLKEIFVTRAECQENNTNVSKKFANDDKRLAVIEAYQRIQIWIMCGIGAGVIGILVKLFVGADL